MYLIPIPISNPAKNRIVAVLVDVTRNKYRAVSENQIRAIPIRFHILKSPLVLCIFRRDKSARFHAEITTAPPVK